MLSIIQKPLEELKTEFKDTQDFFLNISDFELILQIIYMYTLRIFSMKLEDLSAKFINGIDLENLKIFFSSEMSNKMFEDFLFLIKIYSNKKIIAPPVCENFN